MLDRCAAICRSKRLSDATAFVHIGSGFGGTEPCCHSRRCDADATVGTSNYRVQRELFIGAINNEYCKGSFVQSRSGRIQLQNTGRPDASRTASRRATTCRAARHETSVSGQKLVYPGWAKLSHRSTATFVSQSTILIATRRSDPALLRLSAMISQYFTRT